MFETGKGLVQNEMSSKANMANAPAVARLTLLASANVKVKESFTAGRYQVQTASFQFYNSDGDCD
jgi:hypothetical protein